MGQSACQLSCQKGRGAAAALGSTLVQQSCGLPISSVQIQAMRSASDQCTSLSLPASWLQGTLDGGGRKGG